MTRAWATRLLAAAAVIGLSMTVATADEGPNSFSAQLSGFNEVLPTGGNVLTNGSGSFHATIHDSSSLTYTLQFSGLTTHTTQAHIHFAERGVNGGVFLFLCSNLGNGPAGTPACPDDGTKVTRTVSATDLLGLPAQNVPAGSFESALRILRSGDAYANVHSTKFPGGEIRGQLHFGDD